MIEQSYKLNMIPGGAPTVVNCSRYDVGSRNIVFELYCGATAFHESLAGATVTVEGTKPDGTGFSSTCTLSDDRVTVCLTKQMTDVAGRVTCGLTLTKDSEVLTTANFILNVEEAPLDKGAEIIKDAKGVKF